MAKTLDLEAAVADVRTRAGDAGLSVREYVSRRLESAEGPLPNVEWAALLLALPRIESSGPSSAEVIRELRGPLPDDHADRC
jgi:hypothetical protein